MTVSAPAITQQRRRPASIAVAGRVAAKRRAPEELIHRNVVAHLALRARPGVAWFHPANGGARSKIEAARFKAMGVVAGVPDLVVIVDGVARFLELKAEKGRVSPEQAACHAWLAGAGGEVAIAHGLDEALDVLARWGAITTTQKGSR